MGVVFPQAPSYAPPPMCASGPPTEHHNAPIVGAAASAPRFTSRYRNPSEWRTPDDRPICFSCSRVGHISRHCRNRRNYRPSFPSDRRQDRGQYYSTPLLDDQFPARDPHRLSSRSESTYADVAAQGHWSSRSPSPQIRQSRSPQRRRSPSPASSGHHPGN